MRKPSKKLAWHELLAPIILRSVDERVEADGYAGDSERWLADTLTIASRSEHGCKLRLRLSKRTVVAASTEAVSELELFKPKGGPSDDAA